jgi:hypothetical protein
MRELSSFYPLLIARRSEVISTAWANVQHNFANASSPAVRVEY